MKQTPAILKDLQESGHGDATVGHGMIQSGQQQEVANTNHVKEQPETDIQRTKAANNLYRISTEPQPEASLGALAERPAKVTDMPPELAMVIAAWPRLPGAMKAGIVAMVEAASTAVDRLL